MVRQFTKADTATVYADHAATINLVANDTDADGDRFTIKQYDTASFMRISMQLK